MNPFGFPIVQLSYHTLIHLHKYENSARSRSFLSASFGPGPREMYKRNNVRACASVYLKGRILNKKGRVLR